MVDGVEGCVSCTLPDGSELPWHACNVDAIKTREQRGGTRVHDCKAVAVIVVVIICVYPDDVLTFLG